ncbi:hypothetical protein Vadar_000650 [Vaccinium darrowii]|uniref:Uncharacterized protein n=1 Tax=Vaccinium darrowii TaxID=229202 RepID=A0ACB7WWC7_9ERIC|nr:hypothetical protein Vadar_000650 [Vaccinium darrowii]
MLRKDKGLLCLTGEFIVSDMVDVAEEECDRDEAIVDTPKRDNIVIEGDMDFEPRNGIEFESHEYGVTPESDGGSGRRPGVKKTDCKASMHVKRRKDGKWYIHEFIKEHNHELLPALAYHFRIHRNVKLAEKNNIDILHAVSERTRKMYVEMSRQSAGYQNLDILRDDMNSQFDKGRYEEEAIADFDTWNKQPALKSPSPWEKQMSTEYTHAIFKKFQVEVLGVVGCHPRKESEDGANVTFTVDDCEKGENFMVTWNEAKSNVSCSCLLFEYRGYLCRHAMIVLQICGLSSIPSHYILKRWTKDAKSRPSINEGTERIQTRVQRYNDLCKRAIALGEEGSLSEEGYNIAFRAVVEALKNCVNVNNRSAVESSNTALSIRDIEEENQGSLAVKTSKKRTPNKRRKVQKEPEGILVEPQDSLQHMENLSSEGISLNGYYGTQPNVQGLLQLNLMEPPHDAYYVNQETMQGLGQLSSMASSHGGFFGTQQSMHGLGHLDFRPQTSFSYSLQDDPSLRSRFPDSPAVYLKHKRSLKLIRRIAVSKDLGLAFCTSRVPCFVGECLYSRFEASIHFHPRIQVSNSQKRGFKRGKHEQELKPALKAERRPLNILVAGGGPIKLTSPPLRYSSSRRRLLPRFIRPVLFHRRPKLIQYLG